MPGDLSLTPGPPMAEGENGLHTLSSDLHMLSVKCVLGPHPQIKNKLMLKLSKTFFQDDTIFFP